MFLRILRNYIYEPFVMILLSASMAHGAEPVPFLNNPLAPTSAAPGSAAFTLTVNGANFNAGATVYWNGSARATTFVNATQLIANILASDVEAAGTAAVTVRNPGSHALSTAQYFSVTKPRSLATTPLSFALTSQELASSLFSVAVADFNGDGKMDIAGIDFATSATLSVYLGNGDGTFRAPFTSQVPAEALALTIGDINSDGIPDLAVEALTLSGYVISVLLGNGDGTFAELPEIPAGSGDYRPVLVAGDFNRDGNLDLATTNTDGGIGHVALFLGDGDGTFQPYQNIAVVGSGIYPPMNLAVGDFNRDGKLDLATFTVEMPGSPGLIYLLLGHGDGSFAQSDVTTPADLGLLAVGDVNGDGVTDLVTLASEYDLYRGIGNGTFRKEAVFHGGAPATDVALVDLNGDNRLDLVGSNFGGGASIYMNEANGFGAPVTSFQNMAVSFQIAAGDFNNDGWPDLLISNFGIYLATSVYPSVTTLDFPMGKVGTPSPPQSFTLTNFGPTAISLTAFSFSGPNADEFSQTSDCGQVLRAHSSCLITVTFLPTVATGAVASLSIGEGTLGTQLVQVTGVANGIAPVVSLSGYQLNFGPVIVGKSAGPGSVGLTDIGSGNIRSLAVGLIGDNASDFKITKNTCPSEVRSGQKCNVSVVFAPTGTGPRNALLTFTDNAYGSPQTVTLNGTGQ